MGCRIYLQRYSYLEMEPSLIHYASSDICRQNILTRYLTHLILMVDSFAEEVRFELTVPCETLVFKTSAIDHSATPPVRPYYQKKRILQKIRSDRAAIPIFPFFYPEQASLFPLPVYSSLFPRRVLR